MAVQKPERTVRCPAEISATVASLAHEINNPLDSLLNFLYLIETEATLDQNSQRYLLLAREEVRRISQIAHRAMHECLCTDVPHDANIPALLRSVLEFYKSRFESKGIGIQTRYCSDGDLAVDPIALRQMLSNLILNATDAMPAGGTLYARVSMAQEWSGRERRGVRITFADNGCGITVANLPKITEPFFTTKEITGTGLGLALVKDTVEKYDGVLRVRSSTKLGRSGSVFAIFLPYH